MTGFTDLTDVPEEDERLLAELASGQGVALHNQQSVQEQCG